jgi:hypothetical protein
VTLAIGGVLTVEFSTRVSTAGKLAGTGERYTLAADMGSRYRTDLVKTRSTPAGASCST